MKAEFTLTRNLALLGTKLKNQKSILSVVYLLCSLYGAPAWANTPQVGVVKTGENANQWGAISKRLQQAGVNYCLVDANWKQKTDLEKIKVLFLFNIETLSSQEVLELEAWMNKGGKVIVTGTTGNLSNVVVKDKIRALFGAYWGFPLSSPSRLKTEKEEWKKQKDLSITIQGGALIPSAVNSQTAAVWLNESKLPAVVLTDRSTFLGWRWGFDSVASPAQDTAWLKATLGRYGIPTLVSFGGSPGQPKYCNGNYAPIVALSRNENPAPQRKDKKDNPTTQPNALLPSPQSLAPHSFVPSPSPSPTVDQESTQIKQFDLMGKELKELIARVESTILTADASTIDSNPLTEKAIREPTSSQDKSLNNSFPVSNTSSHRLLTEAQQGLKTFYQLIEQKNYTLARQKWIDTRRNLWENYPSDRLVVQPEVRAIWVDRGTIVQCKSEAELAAIFDRLAQAGINTVFFETINASYPIYPSRIAPEQNPLTRGWDPLKAAVKLAHERNIELHAWIWVFAAANQAHNNKLNQPLDYLGPVLSRHPDWAITDAQGNVFDHSTGYKKAFFDPANPSVQRYVLSLIEEIAANYDVDGIQLDYIRYPFQSSGQTFGYSDISRGQFQAMTGIDPVELSPSNPLWNQWTGFRIKQVDNFVQAASQLIKQKYPDKILSVAVFPMEPRERLFRIQQNWEEWARNHWVDLVVLMTYALDTENLGERTRHLEHPALTDVSSLIIPGLRLLNVPNPVTVDQIQSLRGMASPGYALFAAENLNSELEDILKRTQGNGETQSPLPYRQPFQSALQRYQLLQKEWSFLYGNKQLNIEDVDWKDLTQRADKVGAILNQLAVNPSPETLKEAETALQSFQRKFPRWMQEYQKTQPYQVQSWANRLETLDQLLKYGKSTVLRNAVKG